VALSRGRWLWGPALAGLVVVVALLPPRDPEAGGALAKALDLYEEPSNYQPRYARNALEQAVATQEEILRRSRVQDSLRAVARGSHAVRSEDGSVTVTFEVPLTADSARTFLRAAMAELAMYPKAGSRGLPVFVVLYSSPIRRRSHSDDYGWWTVRSEAAPHTADDACIVEVNLLARREAFGRALIAHDPTGAPVGHFLDGCVLYARFGLPGPWVERWMGARRWWWWGRRNPLASRLLEARRAILPETIERAFDVRASASEAAVPWVELGCLDGGSALCRRWANLETGPAAEYYYRFSVTEARGQVLAYVLARGTAAQFQAFWVSPLPTAQALEAAYGQPAGQVVMAAFSHWYRASAPGGPHAGVRILLVGVFWAALALALALIAGRRWTTEI
jgi:hypothetical protein